MKHGKIIVIEGLDGCGKQTQSKILFDKFFSIKKKVKLISMPNYQIYFLCYFQYFFQYFLSYTIYLTKFLIFKLFTPN